MNGAAKDINVHREVFCGSSLEDSDPIHTELYLLGTSFVGPFIVVAEASAVLKVRIEITEAKPKNLAIPDISLFACNLTWFTFGLTATGANECTAAIPKSTKRLRFIMVGILDVEDFIFVVMDVMSWACQWLRFHDVPSARVSSSPPLVSRPKSTTLSKLTAKMTMMKPDADVPFPELPLLSLDTAEETTTLDMIKGKNTVIGTP